MAFFNFGIFGEQEHRKFNYKPRYYDPEEDAMKEKFASVDGTMEKKEYVPGSYVRGAFKRENRYRTSGGSARTIVSLVGLLLLIVALIYMARIFPSLLKGAQEKQAEEVVMTEGETVGEHFGTLNADEDGNVTDFYGSDDATVEDITR